jgi:hypothetical protein
MLVMPLFDQAEANKQQFTLMLRKDVKLSMRSTSSVNQGPVGLQANRTTSNSIDDNDSQGTMKETQNSKPVQKKTSGFLKPTPIVTNTKQTLKTHLAPHAPLSQTKKSSIKSDSLTSIQLSLFNFINGHDTGSPMKDSAFSFETMLSNLDLAISNNGQEPTVGQVLGNLEKDIEALLSAQLSKATEHRRRSRLSQLYNSRNPEDDIDSERLFEYLKQTGDSFSKLEEVIVFLI